MPFQPAVAIWKKAPFIRITPPFLLGIALEPHLPFSKTVALAIIGITAIYLSLTYFNNAAFHYANAALDGIMMSLLLLGSGIFCAWQQDTRNHPQWFGHYYRPADLLVIELNEPVQEKKNSYLSQALIRGLVRSGKFLPADGKMLVFISKHVPQKPKWGDRLLISSVAEPLHLTNNPGAFDPAFISMGLGFFHQVYLDSSGYRLIDTQSQPMMRSLVYEIREKIISYLKACIPGKKESGMAEALLIGFKQDLDRDIVDDYTSTGVVHIIAISGMHLGLIYFLLHTLFAALPVKGLRKWPRAILMLAGIWIFSLIAGAGPSILRSAIMYSSLITGALIKRNNDPLNALFASALLLVCLAPSQLLDAGFQLSYLAVLGLLLFQKKIRGLWSTRHKWIQSCGDLLSLSLSAQMLTFPVSIYHFHQFPVYFLLTNLIAVPFSSLLLGGILLLFLLYPLIKLAALLGTGLMYAINLLNQVIHYFAALPLGTWQQLHLSLFQCFLLYALLLLPAIEIPMKRRNKLGAGMGLLILLLLLRCQSFYQAERQKKLVVYDMPKKNRMDIYVGRTAYSWNPDTSSPAFMNNTLKQCREHHRINKVIVSCSAVPYDLISIGTFRILCLRGNTYPGIQKNAPAIDLLCLSDGARLNVEAIGRRFQIRQVVIDRTVTYRRAREWGTAFVKAGIPCHNIVDKGAFVINLP